MGNSIDPDMLLFPFGNLSHTSILYYNIIYAEVKYNVFNNHRRVKNAGWIEWTLS